MMLYNFGGILPRTVPEERIREATRNRTGSVTKFSPSPFQSVVTLKSLYRRATNSFGQDGNKSEGQIRLALPIQLR